MTLRTARTAGPLLAGGLALAVLTACSPSTDGGDDAFGPPAAAGALVELQQDTALGFAEPEDADDGATYLRLALVGPGGEPLAVTTRGDGTGPQLLRGSGATASPALDVLGATGVVTGAAVAPDGTLVVLGAMDGPGAVVVRVAPDDTAQVLPTPLAPDSAVNGLVGFSPDASRAVVVRKAPDTVNPALSLSGEVEVVAVDTTTGAAVQGPVLLPFREPVQRVPGGPDAVEPRAVAVAADGTAALAVDVREDDQGRAELLRLDAALQPVGEPAALPMTSQRDPRALATGPDGALYATALRPDPDGSPTTAADWGGALVLLRLAAAAAEPEEVTAVTGESLGLGLAVSPDGAWAYLGGSFARGASADFLPVDLATGEPAAPVVVCDDGLVADPSVDPAGEHLVVSGTCDADAPGAVHTYVLTAAS